MAAPMRAPVLGVIAACAATLAALAAAEGCVAAEGCLAGDDGTCLPRSPCRALAFSCDDTSLELRLVGGAGDRPPGLDALAARGDVLLGNSRMIAVLDAIDAPHHLAPSGGTLLDLVPRTASGAGHDELNQVFQAVGILPDDAARYQTMEVIDERPELVAVIVRGRLDGRPDVHVVTRWEVRPCEPGVRVRTEVFHGERDPQTFFLSDAFYWGGREATPFVPLRGQGFVHPDLDLAELGDAYRNVPFMAAQGHAPGASAYAALACDRNRMEGFQSTSVSAAGAPRAVVLQGDGLSYERFLAVAEGPGLSGAANVAMEARAQLWKERSVIVTGRCVDANGAPIGGDARLVSLLFYQPAPGGDPDDPSGRTPWNEAVPAADGSFRVRLPAGKAFRAEAHVLGRALPAPSAFVTAQADSDIGTLTVPRAGVLSVRVTDGAGVPVLAEIVLTPAAPTLAADVNGSIYGELVEDECAPYLGAPHGGSPACNRALTELDGTVELAVPAGNFWVYATRGPFATLDRKVVTIEAGADRSLDLVVDPLPDLVPAGVLSADFHVHAGASFDSSLPELDRAKSFVASGVQVLAATDHDVITTYGAAIAELGIADRVIVMPGVETTGQILFARPPGSEIPQVIGHYNFWPLVSDVSAPRNGAPWDELLEPGALFDRMAAFYDGAGVAQFNHPYAETSFGRDEGYLSAIDYDPRVTVPAEPDELTPAGQLPRRPGGGRSNLDYDVQEVMNGAPTRNFLQYRAGWHSFLSQGILRGGTANSDSHTLAVEVMGWPRNLVFGGHTLAAFDRERFNADVRAGRMVGTNGPVLLAEIDASDGGLRAPSLSPITPAEGARLRLEVRAAPWIPVEEIRILVNGQLARTIAGAELTHPDDPFGSTGLLRYQGELPLSELLAGINAERDAWIVIEAGLPLWFAADLDDDGVVDTTDNDESGTIDGYDILGREDEDEYLEPPMPAEGDPRLHVHVVGKGAWPTAFTNPLLIDRAGDGWTAPGLP
jgi:hypothetical protein